MLAMEKDPDFVSQKKQKRRCDGGVSSSKRFLKLSESKIASILKPFVPSNTKKNTSWAVNVF